MATKDAVAAAALLGLGGFAMHQAARLPFGTARNPGQGFFPWWAGLAMALLALVLLAQPLVSRLRRERHASGPRAGAPDRGQILKVASLLALLGAYALALDPVGYPLCTFVLVLFMLRWTESHQWAVALGLALLAAGGSYLLFAVWLKVPLPPGLLAR